MGGGATSSQGLAFLRPPPLVRFSPAWQSSSSSSFSSSPNPTPTPLSLAVACCSLSLLRSSELARLILHGRGLLDQGGPPSGSRSVYRHPPVRAYASPVPAIRVPLITCIRARRLLSTTLDHSRPLSTVLDQSSREEV